MKSVYLISNGETPIYVGVSTKPDIRFQEHLDGSNFVQHYNKENLRYDIVDENVHDRYAYWLEQVYFDELTIDCYELEQTRPNGCRTGIRYG